LDYALIGKLAWHPAASLEVSPPADVTYLWLMLNIPRQAESDGYLHLEVIIRINLHSVLVLVLALVLIQNHEGWHVCYHSAGFEDLRSYFKRSLMAFSLLMTCLITRMDYSDFLQGLQRSTARVDRLQERSVQIR